MHYLKLGPALSLQGSKAKIKNGVLYEFIRTKYKVCESHFLNKIRIFIEKKSFKTIKNITSVISGKDHNYFEILELHHLKITIPTILAPKVQIILTQLIIFTITCLMDNAFNYFSCDGIECGT